MEIDLTTKIICIDFKCHNHRIHNVLRRAQIETLRELCCLSRTTLMGFQDIGAQSIYAIEDTLASFGLKLSMTNDELFRYQQQFGGFPAHNASKIYIEQDETVWEKRRFEIARDLFVNHDTQMSHEEMVQMMSYVDEFVSTLRKGVNHSGTIL